MMNMFLVLMVVVLFYFLVIKPQQKRMKEHRALIEALKKGDEVITQGGLIGKVVGVRDDELDVELAQGVRVRVVRSSIAQVVNRTAPVAANS